jgi:ABC-type antimicrobial peptide transport system permease subunit
MFFTYIRRELRRRRKQAIVVALGLGLGIGLVVTVSAMAEGVRDSQGSVLRSLYGVATDATVTTQAQPGDGGGARFELNPGDESNAGEEFARDRVLTDPGLGTMSDEDVATIGAIDGVDAASGGLSLTSLHLEGTFAGPLDPGTVEIGEAPEVAPVDVSTFSIAGVDVTNRVVGAVTSTQIIRGRFFGEDESDTDVAIVDRSYAKQEKLTVGDTITIGGTDFDVIGISEAPAGGNAVNVAIPIARARELADLDEDAVNRIYVKATSSSEIASVKSAIEDAFPKATVTTADDLAAQVSGSLSAASNLAGELGRWLSLAALVAAFVIASLLTMSAVGRRVREFGTLKALGWRSRRVVGQVMGESLAVGLIGGVVGVGLGLGGIWLVNTFFPSLEATTGLTGLAGGPGGGQVVGPAGGGGLADALANTVSVPLNASVSLALIALAIGLAVLGGLVAGSFGGWRAARLRPADALRRVE